MVAVAAVLWVLWVPATAWAHAAIISSQPAPGQRLSAAPGAVVLGFSEPLNAKLSRATVTDPTGRRFDGQASGETEIRVPLSTNAPGIYEVEWTTVSTLDGHTLHGSFEFGVGVTPTGASEGTVRSSPGGVDLAISFARAIEYTALLVAMGMLLLGRMARGRADLEWVRPRVRIPIAAALLSGIAVVLAESLVAAPGPSLPGVWSYLSTGLPGLARLARLGLEALALVAAIGGAAWLWIFVAAAVVALAAAGHAAAIHPAWWGIAVDAVHLLAAGLWVGGILALATLRPPGGWGSTSGRSLVSRFSPLAAGAFALTVGFGAVQAFLELDGIHPLVSTSYGWALLVKVALVGAMVPLSLRAWRRRPVPRTEALVAVLVVGAAALLAAYPLPPGRLQAAETSPGATDSRIDLPRAGDLTLGSHAGEALVGLTLRPGQPGENEASVYFLPLAGEQAAPSTGVSLSVDGTPSHLGNCGVTCRQTKLVLQGGETITVRVEGRWGGVASFEIPALPAPDGTRLLENAQQRMHQLSSYRVDESLLGTPTLRSRYVFAAPDRMEGEADHSSQEVWIGQTVYTRSLPNGGWEAHGIPDPLVVPFFVWDYFDPVVAPRIVGTQRLNGRLTEVVSFAIGGQGDPIWFRLWIDRSGLVRRSEMQAPGHYMDHRYFGFDAPVTVKAPIDPA
jgi:copper transport protein